MFSTAAVHDSDNSVGGQINIGIKNPIKMRIPRNPTAALI